MKWLKNLYDQAIAEQYIREETALYRHYAIDEVQSCVTQFTSVRLSDDQTVSIVQKIRNEKGMGPIADFNMPGYISDDE